MIRRPIIRSSPCDYVATSRNGKSSILQPSQTLRREQHQLRQSVAQSSGRYVDKNYMRKRRLLPVLTLRSVYQLQQQSYQQGLVTRFFPVNYVTTQRRGHQSFVSLLVSRALSTTTSSSTVSTASRTKKRRTNVFTAVATAAVMAIAGSSYYSRKCRIEMMKEIPNAQDYLSEQDLAILIRTVQRIGLMGKRNSVKEELEDIRKWHIENGFKGGLVLRDLAQPLAKELGNVSVVKEENSSSSFLTEIIDDDKILARRECYYLYYEVKPTGAIIQQIFCRGTTLRDDVLTCLQLWMVYDKDCQCYVHRGFRDHADRILQDVLPLLVRSPRATIEVCGHSLGGAVATILSVKLRKLGHNVVRLTTVGEPRYILFSPFSKKQLQEKKDFLKLLPKEQIRIENDLDYVTYLPPFGHHVGNKIWLTNDGTARFIQCPSKLIENSRISSEEVIDKKGRNTSSAEFSWTESIFYNCQVPEIVASKGWPHRIGSYVQRLKEVSPVGDFPPGKGV